MNVAAAAAELGVSPRRVRALIESGRFSAHKSRGAWHIDDLEPGRERARRRPLSTRSRDTLAHALHTRTLAGLTGQERLRTAGRIRELRTSPYPARLLVEWWGGSVPDGIDLGSNLVQHALAGNEDYVRAVLTRRVREYLRQPSDLAEVVASERAILGLSRAQLAERAEVAAEDVLRIERARPVRSPATTQRVLRALSVDATALPDLEVA